MNRCQIKPPLLHSFDDQTGDVQGLADGNVDAVYIDLPVYAYYLPKYPGLELTGRAGEKGYYAIAFRKSERRCATSSTRPSAASSKGDKLRPIYEKWDVWNDDQKELAHPPICRSARRPRRKAVRPSSIIFGICWEGRG